MTKSHDEILVFGVFRTNNRAFLKKQGHEQQEARLEKEAEAEQREKER